MKRHFGTAPSFLHYFCTISLGLGITSSTASSIYAEELVFTHGRREVKQLALTFDACSTKENGFEPKIIETLKTTKTPATLFLGGRWMESHPDLIRTLSRSRLFELASHAYTHPHLDKIPLASIERQFILSQKTFLRLTGKKANLFRPPFGDLNDEVVKAAHERGMRTVTWDLPSGDPDPEISLENLIRRTVQNAHNGSIIVMHMNAHGIHTAEALPKIIEGLKKRGFSFVTVGQLVRDSGTQPDAGRK